MTDNFQCGLILLAAGGSTRMGRAKQLLPIENQPLVRYVAERLLRTPVAPVVVVLGAEADRIATTLAGLPLHIVVNTAWQEGLGSSIRAGVEAVLAEAPGVAALMVALADQPGLPEGHLGILIQRYAAGGVTAVASLAQEDLVPPVLFGPAWFSRLRSLAGDTGARALLAAHRAEIALVPIADNTDLDTPADYAAYRRRGGPRA